MHLGVKDFCQKGRLGLRLLPLCALFLLPLLLPGQSFGKIYIDINAPSVRKFNIAIPDFQNFRPGEGEPELAAKLPAVLSNDLDLSGYFSPMDKAAFLENKEEGISLDSIRFKNWSVIGTELLLKGGYACVGRRLEVEVRLYDVFWGREILGKRALGEVSQYRRIMHRLGNEIILKLTGQPGVFLTRLAFVGTATGKKEIYTCDYDGHNVRQITSYGSISLLPRWSPDGKELCYSSYKDGGPMLYRMNVVSGRVKRISSRDGLNTGASFSPDGSKIAVTLSNSGNPDVYIIDADGKILDRLTNHWGIDVSPCFSPDGKKIAYVSNRSGSPQIYVRDLERKTDERLTFEGNYNTSPAWSKINKIAFTSMDQGRFDICIINPDGSQLRKLTENQGNNEGASWSPDGRYIAFSSDRDGGYHLYMMTANGQNQRRITFLPGNQTAPSWGR